MKIARVAIDVPLDQLFDYDGTDVNAADIGCLVDVPFGRRTTIGVLVDVTRASKLAPARIRKINRVLREVPAFTAADLNLMRFAAGYYHYPLGAAIMSTLPTLLRRRRAQPRIRAFALTDVGARLSVSDLPPRATTQRRLLELLKSQQSVPWDAVRFLAPSAPAILKEFTARGWVTPVSYSCNAAASGLACVAMDGPPLTDEQRTAVDTIVGAGLSFAVFLLFGVTGSGKTEVYLHAMAAALRAGRQVLVLVPEIALTPQLERTLRDRFPATPLVMLHSALNETEREANWSAAQAKSGRIVLGTRLAVFAPLPELGLVIVDEEHDASFKQFDGLRYSARDLAIVRARQRDVPIVLGSATPALETYYNAMSGRYRLLALKHRINGRFPKIDCVSTREQRLPAALSSHLLARLEACLARGEQSLVFVNRRGYAPVLLCRACGWLSRCHRCSANLVFHITDRRLKCHHCGHQSAAPSACPGCGNTDLGQVGHGTQRLEAELRSRFPGARVLRVDRDSTRRRLAWQTMRRDIENREVDILVGTQIMAKGHDFPYLSLVGVVNADSLLYHSDIRAPERLYALLTQVAGRAGRGDLQGEVLIQTDFPQHPLYQALKAHDYEAYARTVLAERRESGFPPYVHQALLRAEAPRLPAALDWLAAAARIGRTLATAVTIYDPVPAAMPRLAGRERAQLLVQCASRAELQAFLTSWQTRLLALAERTRARWSLDVDPLEF